MMLRLSPGPAEIIDEAPVGRIYKDGRLIGDLEEMAIGERRKLSFVGHVVVNVLLDAKYELDRDPEIITQGVPAFDDEGDAIADLLVDAAIGAVDSIPRARRKDLATVRESVRRSVRAEVNNIWGKKPVTTVLVTRI
jgi:ribonuclease J